MRMRILHVVPSFGIGGMEKVLCSIINGTSQDFFHEILPLENEVSARKWIEDETVKILPFKKAVSRFHFFRDLYRVIKSSSPHILMTYNWGATDAIWLGRLAGISTIYHSEHGFNVDEAKKRDWKRNIIRTIVYRLANRVIVVSKELRDMLKESHWLNANQLALIPNGINCESFTEDSHAREQVRQKFGVRNNEILLGFLGRFDPIKNFDLLLDSFEMCVKEDSSFKLMLIGDGPQSNYIQALCREKHIEEMVVFAGRNENVLPFIQALDIFVLTSFREQLPMSLLEAMAVGIPVVSTAVGDIPSLIEEGKQGLLVRLNAPETTKLMSSCFLQLRNQADRQTMGRACRQKILSNFEEKTMLRSYFQLLNARPSDQTTAVL